METQTETDPTGNRRRDAREFVRYELRMNPDLQYDALKAKAALEGVVVHPIVFGRMRRELGLAPALPPRRERQPEQIAERPAVPPARSTEPAPIPGPAQSPAQQGTQPWSPAAMPQVREPATASSPMARHNAGWPVPVPVPVAAPAPTRAPQPPVERAQPSLRTVPGGAAKQAVSAGADLQHLVRLVREAAEEQQRMRAALERIRGILDAALDD